MSFVLVANWRMRAVRAFGVQLTAQTSGRVKPALYVAAQEYSSSADNTGASVKGAAQEYSSSISGADDLPKLINLHTIPQQELESVLHSWGHPKYRAGQVLNWVRNGVSSMDEMANIPKALRKELKAYATIGSLTLDTEQISKDGTIKRAYRLWDGQLIESVLMPYEDGRNTACISSQAGCAMGCVFCATGQMGFARQLSPDEIFEQVARFAAELQRDNKRLSNIVFMGMGEPLANYHNVKGAVNRITKDLGIGGRKITISTVGVVPNIRKLIHDPDLPQVRLAVSLHCASDEERTALLPANDRYGGLDELMTTLQEYIETTGRRLTFEWALIEGQNDNPETAHQLGSLITKQYHMRRDLVHVNVIPLNPTGGFAGSPTGRSRVNQFTEILEKKYGISCTPRVRRGIDINAGCGQLKSKIQKKEEKALKEKQQEDAGSVTRDLQSFLDEQQPPMVGVFESDDDEADELNIAKNGADARIAKEVVEFTIDDAAVDFESEEYEDPEFESDWEQEEAERLISLVLGMAPTPLVETPETKKTTSITDTDAVRDAKRRRKKLLKNIKAIGKLREREIAGFTLNEEQLAKVARENEWKAELESVQHNLQ